MFGMGWPEIFMVIAIAIMVIGPEQLPGVARTIGRMLAQFKRAANDLKSAVGDEIAQHEEFNDFKEFSSDLQSEVREITGSAQDYMQSEMKKGEKELDKLEQELATPNEDTGDAKAGKTKGGTKSLKAKRAAKAQDADGGAKPGKAKGIVKTVKTKGIAKTVKTKGGADGGEVSPPRKESA